MNQDEGPVPTGPETAGAETGPAGGSTGRAGAGTRPLGAGTGPTSEEEGPSDQLWRNLPDGVALCRQLDHLEALERRPTV